MIFTSGSSNTLLSGSDIGDGPKVNLGCGPVQPGDWINVDGSNRAWLANRFWPVDKMLVKFGILPKTAFGPHVTIHNLFKRLPFPDNSIYCIYAGEVWEHFEYPDTVRLTSDCFRVLKPGGILRLCVPDGATFWQSYLNLYHEQLQKDRQSRSSEFIRDHVRLFFKEIATRRIWFGSMGHKHKWQFDEVQLIELLERAGFASVDRMPFHHSRIPDIVRVERSDYCIVEGVKPGRQ